MVLAAGCTAYTSASKAGKNVYVTGQTSFLVFQSSWIKRCIESGSVLVCQELDVESGNAPVVELVPQATQTSEQRLRQLEQVMPSLKKKPDVARSETKDGLPTEVWERLQKLRSVLVGCRDSYAKEVQALTFSMRVKATGEIEEIELKGVEKRSPFGECATKALGFLTFDPVFFKNPSDRNYTATVDLSK